MNKELEEAVKRLTIHKNPPIVLGYNIVSEKDIETVLNYIDNSISKEVVKEKIEELEKSQTKVKKNNLIYSREDVFRFQIYILEELLEGK